MNLHEFQAKQLFTRYGIATPEGQVVTNGAQAKQVAEQLGGKRWVVKAQVHTGGRGKAGGVKLVDGMDEVADATAAMLGRHIVTKQTTQLGLPVHQVLIEQPSAIARELYLAVLVDRVSEQVVFMISAEGGMDIEEVAEQTPEAILNLHVDPVVGLQGYQCRRAGFFLNLTGSTFKQLHIIMQGLYRLFTENDASLVEINPLVVTEDGALLAVDAKLNLDDNALFRHAELAAMFDASQEDEKEVAAQQFGLNYISLDGEVACMVNGAGLAMATMDLIQKEGGQPANFVSGIPVAGTGKYYYKDPSLAGMVSTEDLVVMLDEMGIETNLDIDKILEIGTMVERIVGRKLRSETIKSGRIPKNLK